MSANQPSTGNSIEVQLARIAERQEASTRELVIIRKKLDELEDRFVTQAEFAPVRTIVYAFVGLILSSVLVGLLALVVQGVQLP